ncbi:MAG: hypothetical protein ABI780_10875 [Ardenticatenales bacterium]
MEERWIHRALVRIAHALCRRRPARTRAVLVAAVLVAAVIAAACLLPGAPGDPAAAQSGSAGPTGPTVLDQIGGVAHGLAVVGDLAYVTVGPRLVVADLSDPDRPRALGRSAPVADVLATLGVHGTIVVAGGYRAVWRFDVADPAAPRLLDRNVIRGELQVIAGRRLYSLEGRTIVLYDLPDGGPPTEIGSYEAPNDVYDVAVGPDDHLYVTDLARTGLAVVDARDPARPREVGRVAFPDTVVFSKRVAVDGTTAYVVTSDGIQSVDVADPSTPRLLAKVGGRNNIEAIAVAGGRLVTGYRQGNLGTTMALEWFETGQPADLPSRGMWTIPGDHYALAAALSGERAVLLTAVGLRVLDFAAPGGPRPAGALAWQTWADDFQVAGTRLTSIDTVSGLYTYDLTATGAVVPAGHLRLPSYVDGIVVQDRTAFVAVSDGEGLHAVSLDDPAAPHVVGRVPGYFNRLAIAGTTVFATDVAPNAPDSEVVRAIDVADPTRPRLIPGTPLTIPGAVWRMAAAGRWLYVANYTTGFWIIDVADPAAPIVAGRVPELQAMLDVAVVGNLVYLADAGGLRILDVADPAAIRQVGLLPLPGGATSVEVAGPTAYVGAWMSPETGAPDYNTDLVVVDVRDPAHPREVTRDATLPGMSRARPSPDGARLVVAAGGAGLYSLALPLPPATTTFRLALPFVLRR